MCLAIPSKIVELNDMLATVDVKGARRSVNLMLMPEDVELGDYVLVHAGFAIQKVDRADAERSLLLVDRMIEQIRAEEEGRAGVSFDEFF